jgi:micrococcal nuclease
MRIGPALVVAALSLAACGPKMDDLEKGETGKVAGVIDGDTLKLNTGLKVQLTEIITPHLGYAGGSDEPLARDARATLEKIALGRPARLGYGGAKRFKETTALAQLFVQTEGGRWVWVQEAMLREGMARVRTWRDNHIRSNTLYADEAQARAEKKGIWADKAYGVREADKIGADETGFQIVEGVVKKVAKRDDRTDLDFGGDHSADFSVSVNAADYPAWTAKDAPLGSLQDKRIRVRGYVSDHGGPVIVVDNPQAIEILN